MCRGMDEKMNACTLFLMLICLGFRVSGKTLEVGPDKTYASLSRAVSEAVSGDTICVYPAPLSTSYPQVALRITCSNLTIRAIGAVVLDGEGFDYSGRGTTPRAIVQFDPGADNCILEGFTLIHARNSSYNGAGVRINQANGITIRSCTIRNNDMGVMSNGSVAQQRGMHQLIEECSITDNGSTLEPGFNHNLYLGGVDVTVRRCEIARAVTGHNLKSRAHVTIVEDCLIYHSANREVDIVDDAGNTDIPGSDAILRNNRIIKSKTCTGNRGVIHFGKDQRATRSGTLTLEGNMIETPYVTPIVIMSAGEKVVFSNNQVHDFGAAQRGVVVDAAGRKIEVIHSGNRLPEAFVLQASPSD